PIDDLHIERAGGRTVMRACGCADPSRSPGIPHGLIHGVSGLFSGRVESNQTTFLSQGRPGVDPGTRMTAEAITGSHQNPLLADGAGFDSVALLACTKYNPMRTTKIAPNMPQASPIGSSSNSNISRPALPIHE